MFLIFSRGWVVVVVGIEYELGVGEKECLLYIFVRNVLLFMCVSFYFYSRGWWGEGRRERRDFARWDGLNSVEWWCSLAYQRISFLSLEKERGMDIVFIDWMGCVVHERKQETTKRIRDGCFELMKKQMRRRRRSRGGWYHISRIQSNQITSRKSCFCSS